MFGSPKIFFSFLIFCLCLPHFAWALVDINSASSAELETLNGIGPTKAAAIINYRAENGSFSNKNEILNVSGIGDATFEKIKNDITVGTVSKVSSDKNDDKNEDTVNSQSDTGEGGVSVNREPINSLQINVPTYAFVGQSVKFEVNPEDTEKSRLVRYRWNFGDAATSNDKNPVHTYQYAGTYAVVVESYYLKETKTARQQIVVLKPQLSITRDLSGAILIRNDGAKEIDLSGMSLVGQTSFVFPMYSFLLADKTMTVNDSLVEAAAGTVVTLLDQSGTVIASSYVEKPTPKKIVNTASVVSLEVDVKEKVQTMSRSTTSTSSVVTNRLTEKPDPSDLPENKLPYFGLLAVMVMGVVGIYVTKTE